MKTSLPVEIFLQDPSNFICSICSDVSYPLVTASCGHPFCELCISKWITQTKNECPTCRKQNPTPKKPDPLLERVYNSTKVKCLHFSKGCIYQGELKEMLESHLEKNCGFEMIKCTNEGCDEKIERRGMESHLAECEFRSIKCQYCEKIYIFKDEKRHFSCCPNYPIQCNHCDEKMIRDELSQHIGICPEIEVQCTFVGCIKKMKRKDLQNHEKEEFINHLYLMNKHLMEENKNLKNEMKELNLNFGQKWQKLENEMKELNAKCQILEEEKNELKEIQKLLLSMSNICYPFGEFAKSIEWLEKEASKGNPNAQLNLGMCYIHGIHIKIDKEKAKHWIIKAGNQNHLLAIGLCYYFGWGDYEQNNDKAFTYFMESYTKEKDAWAMCFIGYCYFYGHGTTKDEKKAMEWYMKAVTFKCPFAMNQIGYCYDNGIGVEKDYNEALKWYLKGAEGNFSVSFHNLGWYYTNGWGVEKDLQKGFAFYKRAADLGFEDAINDVGYCYDNGIGVEKNSNEAFKWYLKGAEGNHPIALYNAGMCYEEGKGVEKNLQKALEFYTRAANLGHKDAMNSVGYMYANGIGVEKNYNEAFKWYMKGAEENHLESLYNVGECYELGRGVEKNLQKAIEFYKKAADLGDEDAIEKMKNLFK